MKAWLALLRKEIYSNKNLMIWGLIVLFGAGLLDIYKSYQSTDPISIVMVITVTCLHIFYFPIIFLSSLIKEWKYTAQIWLHLPQPGWQLLSAKFVASIIAVVISYCFTSLFVLGAVLDISGAQNLTVDGLLVLENIGTLSWSGIYGNWALLGIAITAVSAYWAVWLLFLFMIIRTAKRFFKKGLWLVGIIALVIIFKGASLIENMSWYDALANWQRFDVSLFSMSSKMSLIIKNISLPFQTGKVLFLALIMAILFGVSSWLLDHKVEV